MLLMSYNDGDTCDTVDMLNGKPLGAIRISLGYCTLFKDVSIFLKFIIQNYLNDHIKNLTSTVSISIFKHLFSHNK